MRPAVLGPLLVLGLLLAGTAGASNPVRISQVYGGAAGGYHRCDYVELFNDSDSPVDIGGWSVQYGSATGSVFGSATYNLARIPAGATIPACGYYLIQGYCTTASGAALPVTPDLTPSGWTFNLSATAGKVALFADQVTNRTCAQAAAVAVDLVGYGSANCFEGAAAAALDAASALVRANGGAQDTDDNGADFAKVALPAALRNTASAPNPACGQGSSPPETPVLLLPPDGAEGVPVPATLAVRVDDADGDSLDVRFYGQPALPPPGPECSLVLLPDTQNYTAVGAWFGQFLAQTRWIVDNRVTRNIAAVAHLGDITNNDVAVEYMRADTAMRILEDPATTGLADGIPYVMNIGNHDGSENFNQYFGVSRFSGRGYYGGHLGSTNDHSYILFSGAGLDFVLVSLAYVPSNAALSWAHGVITAHPDRLAIVVSHSMLDLGVPTAPWTAPGAVIYEALKDLPNLILMACGHVSGEGRRADVHEGRPVTTMLTDYQMRANGGSGWLRVLEFVPAWNQVRARTYSPWLDQWEADTDSSSQFTLDGVPLGGVTRVEPVLLGTVAGVPPGGSAALEWAGLDPQRGHEWYVRVSDRRAARAGPVWTFTTAASPGADEPAAPGLAPPAPNPARGALRFSFDLPRPMRARLDVLDVQGRVVAVLADGDLAAGGHERTWEADTHGGRVVAGLYFARLETPEGRWVRRVVRLR